VQFDKSRHDVFAFGVDLDIAAGRVNPGRFMAPASMDTMSEMSPLSITMSFGPEAGVPSPSMTTALQTTIRGCHLPLDSNWAAVAMIRSSATTTRTAARTVRLWPAAVPPYTQIRLKVHCIVQSIREVRHADDQRQLDDLVHDVLASLFVRALAQRRGPRVTHAQHKAAWLYPFSSNCELRP